MKPTIQAFFDPATATVTYVVHDATSAAIVDPVLDFDPKSGRTSTASADRVVAFVRSRSLRVEWILETQRMPTTLPPRLTSDPASAAHRHRRAHR